MAWILAVAAICAALWALSQLGSAVTLDVVAHWHGQGYGSLVFTGQAMNVSLTQNGTGWDMLVEAMA